MSLEFKKIEVNSIQEMLPFYARRHNMTCDSVFLESYVWKDYYNVRYAIWENKALLWLMENEGRCFSAMPLCREEDLPGASAGGQISGGRAGRFEGLSLQRRCNAFPGGKETA